MGLPNSDNWRLSDGDTEVALHWCFRAVEHQEFGLAMSSFQNRLKHVSPEIIYSDGGFLAADHSIIALLKDKAGKSTRRRCRLCFHAGEDASQQEMLIVMHSSS